MQPIMELRFNREQNRMERLTFIRRYSKWVKSVPYEVWSRQQASLINSFLSSSKAATTQMSKHIEVNRDGNQP
uniref:Uncharacterized protein n=1 Tax=Candidatus Methanogaster sp. ANME-2c ERB4 TaxID=2759911 RepID=A0A7G9YBR0_9EURY|nr:hypothetical protein COJIHGDB_00002 [Methanosarcinales archaeon ANME-2c ERB4]QNO46874.1 hypothetical protein FLMKKIKB_00002 [Methanosarcinales archaeon ANME-2c ERB4]